MRSRNAKSPSPHHSTLPIFQGYKFFKYSSSILSLLVLLASVYFIGSYLWTALHRIGYPFELEWQEGAIVDHCRRVLSGRPLYAAPDISFIPFFYPPVYFYAGALLMKLIGVGFFAPRLISFLSSLGALFLIFQIVRKESGSYPGAFLASAFFAAAYRATGAWLDLARVDSLFIFWLALGIFLARRSRGKAGAVLSALVLSVAFHTKQFALLPALAVALYYLFFDRSRFVFYALALAAGTGGVTLLLNYHYRGWYIYYVFELPMSHDLVKKQLVNFWTKDILFTFPVAFAASLYFGIESIKGWYGKKRNTCGLFYLFLTLSLLLAGWLGRGNVNSYSNTLIPLVFAFSLLLGIEIGRWWGRLNLAPAALFVIKGLLLAQFILLTYLPAGQIPLPSDRLAGENLIRFMRGIPGNVFIPYHGFLPYLAGKETSAHWVGMLDVLIAGVNSQKNYGRVLLREMENAFREGKFEILILDREDWFPDLIKENYERSGDIFGYGVSFFPVTGYRTRPRFIYRKIFPEEKF